MTEENSFTADLPDPEAARSFLVRLDAEAPRAGSKLRRDLPLFSDVCAIASFSPLLATTLLQHPDYVTWLARERKHSGVRSKTQLLESLGRFALTNSSLDPHVMLARFRRRELLRIFLSDIRRLATVAEVTEDISNLADAILEHALMLARQKVDNLFGHPLESDDKGRARPAGFCVVSLGKLGSRELNYSSDIDLLFLYSAEGETDGAGSRGSVTNKEYFTKLAEELVRLIGRHAGEGAAYRVDMRLRPNGRLGPLAMSVAETVRYYSFTARDWERQVLIRSRASAGDENLFRAFFSQVEGLVFRADVSPSEALGEVRRSKQRIDASRIGQGGFDVKLGLGGIREIEFIAQALQLAYAGRDPWLRAPHTLISLTRLTEHGHLRPRERATLQNAYTFLRRLEHILQMEHGLQTHLLPNDQKRRQMIGRKMGCDSDEQFESELTAHTNSVSRVFERIFERPSQAGNHIPNAHADEKLASSDRTGEEFAEPARLLSERLKSISRIAANASSDPALSQFADLSLPDVIERHAVPSVRMSALRIAWASRMAKIADRDLAQHCSLREVKSAQAALAEDAISAAMEMARADAEHRVGIRIGDLPLVAMALGKLASGGLDYESDLDLVFVYDDGLRLPDSLTALEFYSRIVEDIVNSLSGLTREGSLYRVDLRLRPHGKNGPTVLSARSFLEYVRTSAAIWELLAYLKMRGVAGPRDLAQRTEQEVVDAVYTRAADFAPGELAVETRRIRLKLEKERATGRGIDIKYGEGGMLDVYFVVRFLQLRDGLRDHPGQRSTAATLTRLLEAGSLDGSEFAALSAGYDFLARLDHTIRLLLGRTTKLPATETTALHSLTRRMGFDSLKGLNEQLFMHRIAIRDVFDQILGSAD